MENEKDVSVVPHVVSGQVGESLAFIAATLKGMDHRSARMEKQLDKLEEGQDRVDERQQEVERTVVAHTEILTTLVKKVEAYDEERKSCRVVCDTEIKGLKEVVLKQDRFQDRIVTFAKWSFGGIGAAVPIIAALIGLLEGEAPRAQEAQPQLQAPLLPLQQPPVQIPLRLPQQLDPSVDSQSAGGGPHPANSPGHNP